MAELRDVETCGHESPDGWMYLHSKCHDNEPTWVRVKGRTLEVICGECDKQVTTFLLAEETEGLKLEELRSDDLIHVDAVARTVHGEPDWDKLSTLDKEFSILSARRVIDAFHVLSREQTDASP